MTPVTVTVTVTAAVTVTVTATNYFGINYSCPTPPLMPVPPGPGAQPHTCLPSLPR